MKEDLLAVAETAVAEARRNGATLAEAYAVRRYEVTAEVRHGKVETLKTACDQGLGIRVFDRQRAGFAFTTNLAREAVLATVARALANAAQTAPDKYYALPEPEAYPVLELTDPEIKMTPVENKLALARRMEDAALAFDPRVKVIESSSYQDSEVEVAIVNTLGIAASYSSAACGLFVSLAAEEDGESQTGFALAYHRRYRELDPEAVGREAAARAVRMLGGKPCPSKRTTVILDPYVATGLLGVLAPALTGEAVQKGRSFFAGKEGQEVASPLVTIVDDGALAGGLASAPFDGEGVPAGRTVLVECGVLKGFVHNVYTARKGGTRSTGNGIRASFKSTPEVGMTNFYLVPGSKRREELIAEVEDGFYVTEVMGLHTANPVSGDFSVGAAGLWISNGELARPVRGVAIAGNLKDLLTHVDGVADDLRWFGSKGAPTVRIRDIAVSGR